MQFRFSNLLPPLLLALAFGLSGMAAEPVAPPQEDKPLAYKVINSFPHDPEAFLQGLVWHDGALYESTGLYGMSSLRKVEFPSGKVLKRTTLSPDLFGEGLALVDNRLIQLTWVSKRGFVYDLDSFSVVNSFTYNTEGWGLAYDGINLIMSDGSDLLTFLDSHTFKLARRIAVTKNGSAVRNLNELEVIEKEIWANVWQTDQIMLIDPASGKVNAYLDLKGILPPTLRTGKEDVLNGIAYDPKSKRIFVSGKFWPKIFEIKIERHVSPSPK